MQQTHLLDGLSQQFLRVQHCIKLGALLGFLPLTQRQLCYLIAGHALNHSGWGTPLNGISSIRCAVQPDPRIQPVYHAHPRRTPPYNAL